MTAVHHRLARAAEQATADLGLPHPPTADELADLFRSESPEIIRLRVEHDRYRRALEQIADAESGGWGRIAHNALRGRR